MNNTATNITRVNPAINPAERVSLLFTADALGPWAFHCHILYHMDVGMFRVVLVTEDSVAEETS